MAPPTDARACRRLLLLLLLFPLSTNKIKQQQNEPQQLKHRQPMRTDGSARRNCNCNCNFQLRLVFWTFAYLPPPPTARTLPVARCCFCFLFAHTSLLIFFFHTQNSVLTLFIHTHWHTRKQNGTADRTNASRHLLSRLTTENEMSKSTGWNGTERNWQQLIVRSAAKLAARQLPSAANHKLAVHFLT